MVTTLKCPSCGTALKLREGYVKTLKEFKCLRCGAPIPVPGSASAADEAAASTRHIPVRPILPGATPPSPSPAPTASASTGGGTISVACSGCGRTMNLRAELAGKKVRCKQCQAVTLVPEAAGIPSTAAPPPPPPVSSPTAPPPPAAPPPPSSAPPPAARIAPSEPAPAPTPTPPKDAGAPGADASELTELRRRAEKAELALRALAAQHAEKTADLLHQIETLKRELAEARAASAGLSRDEVARAVDAWAEERRRRVDEEVADLRRRLGLS